MTSIPDLDDRPWRAVLRAEELAPDELRAVTVGDIPILLVRSGEAVLACPPVCPHQEEALEEAGMCSDGVLTCTKHLWQWRLPDGAPLGEAERPLLLYPTKTDGGVIYVSAEAALSYADDE